MGLSTQIKIIDAMIGDNHAAEMLKAHYDMLDESNKNEFVTALIGKTVAQNLISGSLKKRKPDAA